MSNELLDKELGEGIKHHRKEEGLSQGELASKAEISRAYLSDIERGKRSPTYGVVKKLASALGVTVEELEEVPESDMNLPSSLKEFGEKNDLSKKELSMLSRIEYRGNQPQSKEEWRKLYNVIKAMLDEEGE